MSKKRPNWEKNKEAIAAVYPEILDENLKRCTKCKAVKPITEFKQRRLTDKRYRPETRHTYCNTCLTEVTKATKKKYRKARYTLNSKYRNKCLANTTTHRKPLTTEQKKAQNAKNRSERKLVNKHLDQQFPDISKQDFKDLMWILGYVNTQVSRIKHLELLYYYFDLKDVKKRA